MAGVYADIPGTRFALDQDGSVVKWRNFTTGSSWTDVTSSIAETQRVNTANLLELGTGDASHLGQLAIAFPEPRSVSGLYVHLGFVNGGQPVNTSAFEYSTDTTDGTNGTWSSFTATFANPTAHDQGSDVSKPYYRSDIAALSLTNVKGIRIRWSSSWNGAGNHRVYVCHMYGSRPTTGVDRLAFWHPSSDQALGAAYLDFGDIAQGTSVTRQLRLKNLSGTLTANTITLQVSDLLPEYTGTGLQVSTDNVTYQNSVNIGNLAPGAISSTLYVRRSVPAAESTTQRHARLLANAASWS